MAHQVLSVTFEVNAQSHSNGQFSIPAEVCRILGCLRSGDTIRLMIQTQSGVLLFDGPKQLASGAEIYGPDMAERIRAGQRIRVTASRF